jgi:site-specific DNA-methyltransferase (adenine-specific)
MKIAEKGEQKMIEPNRIIHGDCLEILQQIADKSVDLVLTDPPYNISKENDNRDRSRLNSPIMRRSSPLKYDFGEWDNRNREEFMFFTSGWLKECCRVLKNGGTMISFFNKEDVSFLGWEAKKHGVRTRTIFTWVKTNPVPSFRKVNFLSATEFLWIGSKGDKNWTFNFSQQKEMMNYYITANSSAYGETEHPTEKPLSLVSHLIQTCSNTGDLILDPFTGSGTTCVAAKNLGRRYIGIEKEEKYYNIAVDRINNTAEPLF